MSTTTVSGWEDEEFEDWWPANPEHESEGGSPELRGVPSGPDLRGMDPGEAGGEADGIPGGPAPLVDGPVPAPHPRQDQPSLGDQLMVELGAPLRPKTRRRRTVRKTDKSGRLQLEARQRLLLLDTWLRSKLPAKDFAALVGVSQYTLYKWKQRFEDEGPAGLANRPKKSAGKSRLPDATKRAILMLKDAHPDWGQDRIHDVLVRTEGFAASPGAIGRVLLEQGYVVEQAPTRPHPDKKRRFERARPNQMWQTDLFCFMLKRENRRVHLVGFMDDHSRFVVGWGLHASASGALVKEVFESGVANFGAPEEVLTDNGSQYHTWRGRSAFRKLLDKRGIRQIVARPRHPQTLGKIERFWGTLWQECVQQAIFRGIDDARARIGHFVSWYNFQRPHQGIDGSVPADRFFDADSIVRRTLEERVAKNALELARDGEPRKTFYLTGRVGDESLSVHGEEGKVVYTKSDGTREEVDLNAPGRRELLKPPMLHGSPPDHPATEDDSVQMSPGESPLDGALEDLARRWPEETDPDVESTTEKGDES